MREVDHRHSSSSSKVYCGTTGLESRELRRDSKSEKHNRKKSGVTALNIVVIAQVAAERPKIFTSRLLVPRRCNRDATRHRFQRHPIVLSRDAISLKPTYAIKIRAA
jgi:hypothetical protein